MRPQQTSQPLIHVVTWDATDRDETRVSARVWDVLCNAATRDGGVCDQLADDGMCSGPAKEHLASMCDAVRRVCAGQDAGLALSPSIPARRMAEALRRQFLLDVKSLPEHLDAGEVVEVLMALDHVQTVIDADAAQRFAHRLSGHDSLDLIVEVAHDMRSPLGSILFLVETMRKARSGTITPIQERQLGLVYNAAFGLSSLASDLIELARGCERLVDLHPIPFSLSEILQAVVDIVQPIAEEKGLTISMTPPEADVRIGQPAALNRVLLNLTTNALKFTSSGQVEVICKPLSRTRLEFAVRDTGKGIPPAVMSTLFDAFRRRQRPGDYTFSSAGLGLAICHKLVDVMGGELRVETAPDRGTCFFFELDLPPATTM